MSMPTFNVLTEDWVPVIRRNGSRAELGILPCLEQAPELREIRDPSPIIEFGLYRILVAFVLDALVLAGKRPEDAIDLRALIQAGRFDMDLLRKYADSCGDVFDLFHAERPFLQCPLPNAQSKPLAAMSPAAPSGTNAWHWHHEHESGMIATAPEAAKLLTTIAPFMTAGGAGLSPSINGAPAIYSLPMGASVFETIALNLPTRRNEIGQGTVAWRNTRVPGEERSEATTEGVVLGEAGQDVEVCAKIAQGLQHGRELVPGSLDPRGPVLHRDAVRHEDERHAVHPGLTGRLGHGAAGKHPLQHREGDGGSNTLEKGSSI